MTEQTITSFVEIWPACGEASQAIYTATRRFVTPIIEETELTQPRVVYVLLMARALEPRPISPDRIWQRYPYGAKSNWEQTMDTLAERQLLEPMGGEFYQLTPAGRALAARILKEFYTGLAGIETSIAPVYPAADLDRLAVFLNRIVAASFNAPIGLANLTDGHGLAPNGSACVLADIDQALDDLNAFRDDAHLAAWQPLRATGPAWELFTFLWRGEVKNAAEMAEKAAQRGHSREIYQSALGDLIGQGWVRAAGDDAFEVTEAGRQVRDEAEAETDRNFYTPWQTLNDREAHDLRDLLTRLTAVLQSTTEAVPA